MKLTGSFCTHRFQILQRGWVHDSDACKSEGSYWTEFVWNCWPKAFTCCSFRDGVWGWRLTRKSVACRPLNRKTHSIYSRRLLDTRFIDIQSNILWTRCCLMPWKELKESIHCFGSRELESLLHYKLFASSMLFLMFLRGLLNSQPLQLMHLIIVLFMKLERSWVWKFQKQCLSIINQYALIWKQGL